MDEAIEKIEQLKADLKEAIRAQQEEHRTLLTYEMIGVRLNGIKKCLTGDDR